MKTLIVTLLAVMASLSWAQVVVPGRAKANSADISVASATTHAKQFLAKVGLAPQDMSKARVMLSDLKASKMRTWNFSGPRYALSVDTRTGRVLAFHNLARIDAQYRRIGRTGKVRFASESAARAYVETIARKLAVPKGATITSWSYKRDGAVKDQNSSGHFGATYSLGGRPYVSISCDIQDGMILGISFGRQVAGR